jgi:hypothetical protein
MNRDIWEFLAGGSRRVIRDWIDDERISVRERAKLDASLDSLRNLDFALVSKKLLAGPIQGTKVYKLRLRCENRELRPMLCRGPVGSPLDYTLLEGAIEVGGHLRPSEAEQRADKNRVILIERPHWRGIY